MAGQAKENLPGGSLKYLFVYLKVRILITVYMYIYLYHTLCTQSSQVGQSASDTSITASNSMYRKDASRKSDWSAGGRQLIFAKHCRDGSFGPTFHPRGWLQHPQSATWNMID